MSLNELNQMDKKIQPTLQYKLSHQWLLVYFGIVGVLMAVFVILMSIDEQRFLPIGIVLLALFVLVTIAYLAAMVVVRKKVLEPPEKKDGAKHPARIPISAAKYKQLRRQIAHTPVEKGRLDAYRFFFADQLMNGDLQPAMVVSCQPLTIAVYSDEIDGALLLTFPEELAESYHFKENERLVATVCYYKEAFAHQGLEKDIFPGPEQTGKWMDLLPVLPVFLTDDEALLKQKEAELPEELWRRAADRMARQYAIYPEFDRAAFWFTHLSPDDWDRHPIFEAQR